MIKLKRLLTNKSLPSKSILVSIGVSALLLLLFFYYFPRTEFGVKRFYSKQLGRLSASVDGISGDIESSADPRSALNSYGKKLDDTLSVCKKIQSRYRLAGNKSFKRQVKDTADGAKKLCDDLVPILSYSKELYASLAIYILYDTSAWPSYDNETFGTHMAETQGMIRTTLPRLEKINYPQLDDPALGELITQVKSAEKLADEAYMTLTKNDTAKTVELAEKLRKDMHQDKSDFLNARLYFWNNTVQLDSLRQAISQLSGLIKS